MLREARLLSALEGTNARAPGVLAACDDESIMGVPFYVMEEMHGFGHHCRHPDALDNPEQRRRVGEELVDALVEIHAVDWRGAGLEGFGKPTGYLDRQLRRFNGLWEHNKTRELPIVQEMADWLERNKPESPEATIVHGDYRLGNTMVADDAPGRIVAVFDWSWPRSATRSPTWATSPSRGPRRAIPEDTSFGSLSAATRREGFPTREELMARYEERSVTPVGELNWYGALALWKAAVFMEGNLKRFQAGSTDDEYLGLFVEGVPMLAEKAREVALAG